MNVFNTQKSRDRIKRDAGTALLVVSALIIGTFVFSSLQGAAAKKMYVSIESSKPNVFANLPLRAKAAIVYDLAEHKTLFAKNAGAQLPLASITKLLTVYTAVRKLGLNAPITITRADIETEGDSDFKPGEVFTLKNLARYTLTGSINDGAAAIASTMSTHTDVPISRMLEASAIKVGLSQTYAMNGTGLDINAKDGISGGYGSPRDIALLAGALLHEAPHIVSATTHTTSTLVSSNYGIVHKTLNTNQDVVKIPRILLSKTGYTNLAGGNLVIVFDASFGHPIAVVVLGSTEKARFTDVNMLVDATLAHFAGVTSP